MQATLPTRTMTEPDARSSPAASSRNAEMHSVRRSKTQTDMKRKWYARGESNPSLHRERVAS